LAPLPFAESLAGRFVYDDHLLIETPTSVHSLQRIGELWKTEFWHGLSTIHFRYFRPLVSTSYALDWSVWQGQPLGFHLTNLCLHALVSLLLYSSLCRWSAAPIGALLAVLAWAWHPSKVEAVAWISGRTDLLCALGVLVACAGVERRLRGARKLGLALEGAGLFVALASKEHGVVAPAFIAVEAWSHGGRRILDRAELVRLARSAAPHAAIVAAYLAFRFAVFPIVPERTATLSFLDARLYTLETLGEFAHIVFFPFDLSIQRAPIRVDSAFHVIHDAGRLAMGTAFVVVVSAVALFLWKKPGSTGRVVGCLLGLAALAPVANVGAAKMVFLFAERFAYIPLMGFALCVVPRTRLAWQTLVPWSALLIACAIGSARHTRHFLDDRRLWAHEMAANPKQPLALRFACQEAMQRRRYREALTLAMRGYEASRGWPVPQPDRVEFALRAARSLESVTLDARRDVLEEIAEFYDTFFRGSGTARIDVDPVHVSVDAGGNEAHNFRRGDRSRLAQVGLWRAAVASRLDRCDAAVTAIRDYLVGTGEPSGRIEAVLVLGRCARWDEARAAASALDTTQPAIQELVRNLHWIEENAARRHDDLDGALRWSRARTLLLDRGGAYRALLPWTEIIQTDDAGTMFFARTALAAGEDEAARRALGRRMPAGQVEQLLAEWSRELGREPEPAAP
jgi:hypothetical protein